MPTGAWRGFNFLPRSFDVRFARDPHPFLEELRRTAPVHYEPATDLWLGSRHSDVRQVLPDPVRYAPDNAQHAISPGPCPRCMR
ncbi:hypothetical protein ACFWIJ_06535 [Streptomyces sp. NPDC127079]|uniref:hypothetical protein n=1 Tax=Streptomyces sp. NPDC127079 TaxID=3347132 RepID=UPI0036653967